MDDDITSLFLDTGVEHFELLWLLQRHFKSAASTPNDEVVYPSEGEYAIRVQCKSGSVAKISRGPQFSTRELDRLLGTVVSDLVESVGEAVGADILFSSRPVRGSFRAASDRLQILPAPKDAPHPSLPVADHPFVIEFQYDKSPNSEVNLWRRLQQRTNWAWLLNAVINASIKYPGPRARFLWAIPLEGEGDRPIQDRVRWSQEFYMVEGFKPFRDGFSDPSAMPLGQVPRETYYSDHYSDDLELPDNFDGIVQAYSALSLEKRKRFLRAAQLVSAAAQFRQSLTSTYYTTHVQAIEALASTSRPKAPRPTERFRMFLDQYGPDTSESKKQLYKIRSDLAHGHYLLQMDEAPWGLTLTSTYLREQRACDSIRKLVQQTMVAWLFNAPEDPDTWWEEAS